MGGIHRIRKRLRPGRYLVKIERFVESKTGEDILGRSGEETSPPPFSIGYLSRRNPIKSKKTRDLIRDRNEQGRLKRAFNRSRRGTIKEQSVPVADRHLAGGQFAHRTFAVLGDALVERP